MLVISIQILAQNSDIAIKKIKFESNNDTLAGSCFNTQNSFAALVIVHGLVKKKNAGFRFFISQRNCQLWQKRCWWVRGIYAGPEVGTNNVDSANLNLLSLDVSAAANTLLENLNDKHIPLGLIGFSQAGWIIPLTAEKIRM